MIQGKLARRTKTTIRCDSFQPLPRLPSSAISDNYVSSITLNLSRRKWRHFGLPRSSSALGVVRMSSATAVMCAGTFQTKANSEVATHI